MRQYQLPVLGLALLASLTACTLKAGRTTFGELIGADKNGFQYELELASPRFAKNHLDLGLAFTGEQLKNSKFTLLTTSGQSLPLATTQIGDVHLAFRYYPTGHKEALVVPYFGAGAGWFRYSVTRRGEGDVVDCPPGVPFGSTCREILSKDQTLASAFYPHAVAGLAIPLKFTKLNDWIVIESRYDFLKKDGRIDLSGNLFTIGWGIGFDDYPRWSQEKK